VCKRVVQAGRGIQAMRVQETKEGVGNGDARDTGCSRAMRARETEMHVTRGAGAGVRALASPRFLETFTNHCLRLLIYVLLAIAYAATFSKLTRVH